MTTRVLIDMSLSPSFHAVFERHGVDAIHWMHAGDPKATDARIMAWGRANDRIVPTNDLDFATILETTGAQKPSVVRVRAADVRPDAIGGHLVECLQRFGTELEQGAIVVVEKDRMRVRVLPLA